MKNVLYIGFIALILGLSACSGGAVVFVPTPLPPDVSPITYTHPSTAFSLLLPRNWSVYEQANDQIASASFAPPNSNTPLVRVSLVNLGEDIPIERLGDLMLQYQTQIRPDLAQYTEQNRQAMGDGSWRMVGIRNQEGKPQPINTFLQRNGSFFSVLEVVIPTDAQLASDVQVFINTLTINTSATLPTATLSALSGASGSDLEIQHVSAWSTTSGVFYITGEVLNRGSQPLASVPITAQLLAQDGTILAEASDVLMGHVIAPNGYAPFSLRFGQGQPLGAVDFALSLGGSAYQAQTLVVVTAPTLTWQDGEQRGTDGQLYITGTVTNEGNQAVKQGMAVVSVFDANGNVIGAGFAPIESATLAPNGTSEFVVLISDLGGEASNYIVTVQGLP
jgi:hypothetical protein